MTAATLITIGHVLFGTALVALAVWLICKFEENR